MAGTSYMLGIFVITLVLLSTLQVDNMIFMESGIATENHCLKKIKQDNFVCLCHTFYDDIIGQLGLFVRNSEGGLCACKPCLGDQSGKIFHFVYTC